MQRISVAVARGNSAAVRLAAASDTPTDVASSRLHVEPSGSGGCALTSQQSQPPPLLMTPSNMSQPEGEVTQTPGDMSLAPTSRSAAPDKHSHNLPPKRRRIAFDR